MHLKNFNTQEHAVFIFPRRIYFPTQSKYALPAYRRVIIKPTE